MSSEAYEIEGLIEEQARYAGSRVDEDDAYKLKPRIESELDAAIDAAPLYERLAPAAKALIRKIHGVQFLYKNVRRGNLEFYVGRAGATASHAFGRFKSHHKNKDHHGAAIVCRCSTDVVTVWEGAAVRAIKELERRRCLCVANLAAHGGGAMPWTDECVIYLTWGTFSEKKVSVPTRLDVEEVAFAVADSMNGDVSEDMLRRALDPARRPTTEIEDLVWAA